MNVYLCLGRFWKRNCHLHAFPGSTCRGASLPRDLCRPGPRHLPSDPRDTQGQCHVPLPGLHLHSRCTIAQAKAKAGARVHDMNNLEVKPHALIRHKLPNQANGSPAFSYTVTPDPAKNAPSLVSGKSQKPFHLHLVLKRTFCPNPGCKSLHRTRRVASWSLWPLGSVSHYPASWVQGLRLEWKQLSFVAGGDRQGRLLMGDTESSSPAGGTSIIAGECLHFYNKRLLFPCGMLLTDS